MTIPDFQTIMLPFMQLLSDQQTWTTRDLTDRLAIHFTLTEAERHQLLPSGQQAIFTNRVAWAKSHLKNAGLIHNPSRGKVTISEIGLQTLQKSPTSINCKYLKQFPSYLKFIGAGRTHDPSANETDDDNIKVDATMLLLKLINSSFVSLRTATVEEILTKLKKGFWKLRRVNKNTCINLKKRREWMIGCVAEGASR